MRICAEEQAVTESDAKQTWAVLPPVAGWLKA